MEYKSVEPSALAEVPHPVAIRLLGEFAVTVRGQQVSDKAWRLRKVRHLVKLLALAPGRRLHRDQVIDALWPDSDLKAGSNLFYQALHAARRLLDGPVRPTGESSLLLENGFISLSAQAMIDVDAFEAAAQAVGDQDPAIYHRALALYPGDLLPEDRYEEWTLQRRERLRQTWLDLLEGLAQVEEERGNYPAAVAALQRLLAADHSSETAHVGLMRVYALSGERQQALRQYQALRDLLKSELDMEPGLAAEQLHGAIRSGSFPPPGALSPPSPPARRTKHNLPAELTSFVGRADQIELVRELVLAQRLVTLTGSGGIGKTRLALKVAEGLLEPPVFDGVFLVDLASISDPDLVAYACSQALEVLELPGMILLEGLVRYLAQKHLLLILDNCEHLLDACVRLSDRLLKACPRLHILATSREILSVTEERPYRMPSLAVPEMRPALAAPLAVAELAQVEAVELFVARSAQATPGFSLTDANAALIAQLTRRLDGIPLAIELAAARVRLLSVEQIAARLDNAFHLLTGGSRAALPRQQTLKATMDWSYAMLSPKERLLFQRLSVFAGGWPLEAAEAVCADDAEAPLCDWERLVAPEIMDLLAELVDKSLVTVEGDEGDPGTGRRYRLLEMMRQYARDQLVESGCGAAVRDRHLAYYARLTGAAEHHLRSKGQAGWVARLEKELDNLRAALEWSRARDITRGMQIVADLMWFWNTYGLFNEATDWAELVLAAEADGRAGEPVGGERALQRARVLRTIAYFSGYPNRRTVAERLANIEESVRLIRGLPASTRPGASARRELGISLYHRYSRQRAMDAPPAGLEEMLAIFDQEQERFYLAEYYFSAAGFENYHQGNLTLALEYMQKSLAICIEIEDLDGMASRMSSLGDYALMAGDYQNAETLFREATARSRQAGNRWFPIFTKASLVRLEMAQGHYAEASRLGEEALLVSREYNVQHVSVEVQGLLIRCAWSADDEARVLDLARDLGEGYPTNKYAQQIAAIYRGLVAMHQGDLALAEALLAEAVRLVVLPKFLTPEYVALAWSALYMKQGWAERAVRLLGALDATYRGIAGGLSPRERIDHDTALEAARASLGLEAFAREWQTGASMTLDGAFDFVRAGLGDNA